MLNSIYTMSYKDALDYYPSLTSGIVWDTDEHTAKLKEMLYSKFYNWEIAGETVQEQELFLTMKFNQYKDYFAEMLEAYETSIAWLDGEITTHNEEGSFSESASETVNDDTDLIHGHKETNSGSDTKTLEHGHKETDSGSDTKTLQHGHTETDSGSDTKTLQHGEIKTESGTDTSTVTKGISETTTVTRTEEVTRSKFDLPRTSSNENRPSEIVKETPDGNANTTTVTPGNGEDETEVDYGHTLTHSGTDTDTLQHGKVTTHGGTDTDTLSHGKVTTHSGTDTDTLSHGKAVTHSGTDTTNRDIEKENSKSGSNDRESTTKVADLIKQKDRYLKLIRNLYSEFADKFEPCFISLFS